MAVREQMKGRGRWRSDFASHGSPEGGGIRAVHVGWWRSSTRHGRAVTNGGVARSVRRRARSGVGGLSALGWHHTGKRLGQWAGPNSTSGCTV
jgi:hypothetical protein